MNILLGYKKCSTCKNIEKMLNELGIEYTYRDIKEDNPTAAELKEWYEKSGIESIGKLFNTSGMLYRELDLKNKRAQMSLDECFELLATDGMLVKRPILFIDDKIYIGPEVKKYLSQL